ncbi:MAG: hypothetical protein DRI83_13025, partial [Bacteroidetes bacterium]
MIFMVSFGQDNHEPTLVIQASYFDKSPALRDMPAILTGEKDRSWKNGVVENKSVKEEYKTMAINSPANGADEALQMLYPQNGSRGPELGIEGVGNVNGV